MKFVKPEVFLLGKTVLDATAVEAYCKFHGVPEYFDKHFGADALPIEQQSSAVQLTMLAGKRCYKAFVPKLNPNVKKVRDDACTYIDNILDSGHGSVLEHVVFNFGIENISRVFTGELNRHRAGAAISEGSMRYIRFNDIPCCETTLLNTNNHQGEVLSKVVDTRRVFDQVFTAVENGYRQLEEIWAKELDENSAFKHKKAVTSMMRRIVPMGVATGGIWSYNIRSLRHIFGMRCDEPAEEEILTVAVMLLELMRASEPLFFGDFTQNEKGYWRPKYWKV